MDVVQKGAVGAIGGLDSIVSEERWMETGLVGLKKRVLSVIDD